MGSQTFTVFNPSTGKELMQVSDIYREDVMNAVNSAHEAFGHWKNLSSHRRASYLERLHALILDNQNDLATIMHLENGKPFKEAAGEVAYAASFVKWFAEEAKRPQGEVLSCGDPKKWQYYIRQPVGVAGLITPWNFPLAMVTRKIAPALAAGCTVIVKPAAETPLSALALGELCDQAGIPEGCVNILSASSEHSSMVGKILCDHEHVKKISFTGSTKVGILLNQQCATHLKRVSLELGGNAPVIIFPDYFTDKREYVAEVVGYLMAAKFRCSGQTCVSPNRIYIHESLLDDFISIAQDKLKDLDKSVGDNFGPLINEAALDKVDHHVQDARTKGAKVQVGGERYHDRSGYFYKPTLLTDVKDGMLVFKEETFGPVLAVSTFTTEQEVMQRVNANVYGLAGYIFSKSASRIRRVSENIEVGMVGVNTGAISHENSPFGGIKLSGFGREGHSLGLHEYTQVKYIAELK